jgi:hypothetical protein
VPVSARKTSYFKPHYDALCRYLPRGEVVTQGLLLLWEQEVAGSNPVAPTRRKVIGDWGKTRRLPILVDMF